METSQEENARYPSDWIWHKNKNEIRYLSKDEVEVLLTSFFTVFISQKDLEKVEDHEWADRNDRNGRYIYPITWVNRKKVYMTHFGIKYRINEIKEFSHSTDTYDSMDTAYYKCNKCHVRWFKTVDGEFKIEMLLTKGASAKIDIEKLELISQYEWYLERPNITRGSHNCYARNGKIGFMHRLLLPGYATIDHKDGDGLNNTMDNLRGLNKGSNENQNNTKLYRNNTSGINGLRWDKRDNLYRFCWRENNEKKYVSFSAWKYKTKEEAFIAAKGFADSVHDRIENHNGRERFSGE